MHITILVENSKGLEGCAYEHGLSLHIETLRHRILMDAGASTVFLENAQFLGIDLAAVDTCVLSHGHYDHSGGLMQFARINPSASIYMQRSAALDYYADDPGNLHYIGIDKNIAALASAVLLDGDKTIDAEISLLTHAHGRRLFSKSNERLKQLVNGKLIQDTFSHEQALIVHEKNRYCLFSGCSHNGVLNWMDRFNAAYGCLPNIVVGGFHFMKKGCYSAEENEIICKTAKELASTGTMFYTGHCTGERAYALMKNIMKEQLMPLHSGMSLVI